MPLIFDLFMNKVSKLFYSYLALIGLLAHIAIVGCYLIHPDLVKKIIILGINNTNHFFEAASFFEAKEKTVSIEQEIAMVFPDWQPLKASDIAPGAIRVGGKAFDSLKNAAAILEDGDTLTLGEGVYGEPLIITANHVRVVGDGHVVFKNAAAKGKGAILVKGNNITIKNIECSGVNVRDGNGSCVRQQGNNLSLEHVYFHDSQQGLLTGRDPGEVIIHDSRFEKLGANGRAHAIYVSGGRLLINDSFFIAAAGEGHEIKSRAEQTIIRNTLISSLSSRDSRLIDVSNGGFLSVYNSILHQGPNSSNQDLIGFGLENKNRHETNRIEVVGNFIIMERDGSNRLVNALPGLAELSIRENIIISKKDPGIGVSNLVYKSREEAGLGPYPALPSLTNLTNAQFSENSINN